MFGLLGTTLILSPWWLYQKMTKIDPIKARSRRRVAWMSFIGFGVLINALVITLAQTPEARWKAGGALASNGIALAIVADRKRNDDKLLASGHN